MKAHKIQLLSGKTEYILPGGEASVRCRNAIYLVANTLPGEEILFLNRGKRRGAGRGELREVLHASPHRVAAPCPHAGTCGGCSLQFLHGKQHAGIKSGWIRQAFSALICSDTVWLPVSSPAVTGLRRKVRWHRGEDESGSFLGFKSRASNKLVRHHHCMLLLPELNKLREILERNLSDIVDAVSITALADGLHVLLETESTIQPELPHALLDRKDIQCWWQHGECIKPLGKSSLELHDRLPFGNDMFEIQIGPGDFVQSESAANGKMIRQIQNWADDPRRVVDLFAGAGNFSLPLAMQGAEVIGADIRRNSVQAATANARKLKLDVRFEQADLLKDFDPGPFAGADLLILDPPRKGAKRICGAVNALLPQKIIMVSCNIATGARDGSILASHGYRLQALRGLDLFPFSGHVETMSLWLR